MDGYQWWSCEADGLLCSYEAKKRPYQWGHIEWPEDGMGSVNRLWRYNQMTMYDLTRIEIDRG